MTLPTFEATPQRYGRHLVDYGSLHPTIETSSVSVRKRLKNSVKQCETMRGEMPGQPANHLVTGGPGSSSHG